MDLNHCSTEEQIKQYAKLLFFQKGHLNATVQEIADFAGVKRTSVNYYFRSKDKLFAIVYEELVAGMKAKLDAIYATQCPFEAKIDLYINYLFKIKEQYLYLEVFNIQESNFSFPQQSIVFDHKPLEHLDVFLKEIEEAMQKGIIQRCHPINFLINIISLISYPIIMKPIFLLVYKQDNASYTALLKERKSLIKQIIFNKTN